MMKTNVTSGKVLVAGKSAPGLALHGYDAVAYFADGAPKIGDAQFSYVLEDATYRFSSQSHLDTFRGDSPRYVPQFGGYCAFGVSVGAKFDGDPLLWRVVENKLYLNLSADIQHDWLKDVPGNITKANYIWRTLAEKAP